MWKFKCILMFTFITFNLFATYVYSKGENPCHEFVAKPNSTNYMACEKQIQIDVSADQRSNNSKEVVLIDNDLLFNKFLALVKQGNKNAIRLGFQLLSLTDGSKKEDIQISLGILIKKDARFFLNLLKQYNVTDEDMSGLLLNFGPRYVDAIEKKISETKKRIYVIEQVNNKNLLTVKEKSLRMLKEHKEELMNIKKEL